MHMKATRMAGTNMVITVCTNIEHTDMASTMIANTNNMAGTSMAHTVMAIMATASSGRT